MKNSSNIKVTILKMLALILASATILYINKWSIILCIFVLIIVATLITKFLKPTLSKKYCQIFRTLLIIAGMIIIFNMLLYHAPNSWERFISGIVAAAKVVILSLLMFAFTLTTSISSILSVLSFLPKKIQFVLTITFGIIPAIINETHKIILIQSARGIKFNGLNFIKNIYPIIIPLLHRSFQHAEHMAIFLHTRGYEI